MWKLMLLIFIGFVAYMYGVDHGLPERRQLEHLERRIEKLEAHAKATSEYMHVTATDAAPTQQEVTPAE